MTTDTASAPLQPLAPTTLEQTGLGQDLLIDLILKVLHGVSEMSGTDLCKRLGLPFAAIESSLESLKARYQCEISGGSILGGQSFRFRLTEAGRASASASLGRNHYVGVAPVPIAQYRQYMDDFSLSTSDSATPEDVRRVFSDLVVSDRVLDEIGPAVSARHSMFIYGPPGNGKTAMAHAIRHLLLGTIAIPFAIEVGGNIVRFFDPAVHEAVVSPSADESGARYDQRWVCCRRPMVAVGGELTIDSLGLGFNPRSGVYRAPVQALANGGVLVIDDFGRQQCSPRDLLNWWMVPLESGIEYITLQSGEKFEMPFRALVIFSTNLRPAELVDEAFLRRIKYKIFAESPTPEAFALIFERCCSERGIPFDKALVDGMLNGYYSAHGISPRACHPRDLISQALAIAAYQRYPHRLTAELLEAACTSYFIADHEGSKVSG
jgi:hypothetical protein